MPYLVRKNLFIGNIGDAAEVLQKDSTEITHILSVLNSPSISFFAEWRTGLNIPAKEIKKVYVGGFDESASKEDLGTGSKSSLSPNKLLYSLEYAGKDLKLVRMAVPIRDMESEDLLDYLDVCLDFIDQSRKEGSVLVHCFAGVSRSAAIITAYLMRTEQLSQEDALESLRESCEFVCPNDGFLDQLKMFEDMGFKVDRASSIYKRFRLKVLGDSYNRGEKIDSSKFGADPGMSTGVSSEVEASPNGENKRTPAYRCKKCRRVVALQENVVDHIPGEGETSFAWNKRKSGNPFDKSDEPECSSIFVEPLKWMASAEEGALEGKLSCAHCEARLGYFNWSGIQCSCGSWITPAFQLHKSRVDISII
ncbi:Dual specificity protein phosphatase, putative [Ricinus communis]|uniref:protein-tyrosine-phosphatase n=1 Tax=Ricinus communis TaxID=3988 RepID=B9S842_RICCO|nr:Dual specificity protein phosphatase, putative [Ricinus communis]|eukprot:XP_002522161.1 dual specificity protein phosphatase 12 [Ricinus communis]